MLIEFKDDLQILVIGKAISQRLKHLKEIPEDQKLDHYQDEIKLLEKWMQDLNNS
jgi:hypothetical protein